MDHLFVCDPKQRGNDAMVTREKYGRRDGRKGHNCRYRDGPKKTGNVHKTASWRFPGKVEHRINNQIFAEGEMKAAKEVAGAKFIR